MRPPWRIATLMWWRGLLILVILGAVLSEQKAFVGSPKTKWPQREQTTTTDSENPHETDCLAASSHLEYENLVVGPGPGPGQEQSKQIT